jgi:hypothetical protein
MEAAEFGGAVQRFFDSGRFLAAHHDLEERVAGKEIQSDIDPAPDSESTHYNRRYSWRLNFGNRRC